MRIIPTTSLADLIDRYQVFFIDQFGVLRDDAGAYDGAAAAMRELKAAGKTVVILSNSGRSGEYNAERLGRLGFDRATFDHFVTSGDVALAILSGPDSPILHDARCFTISSEGDTNLVNRLGLVAVDNAADADVVIIAGSEAETISMDDYRESLRPAVELGRPCFCINPDIHKLANGRTAPGAGSIAKLYEELGGKVTWLGKPFPDIYEHALAASGHPDRRQVVCIGDSIDHDILGAKNARLNSVLVGTGILAKKTMAERMSLMAEATAWPTFFMPRFRSQSESLPPSSM